MKKPMTKEIAQKMLQSNEESLRDLALLHYPELGDITQRIKTIEDTYKELRHNKNGTQRTNKTRTSLPRHLRSSASLERGVEA